MRRGAQQVRPGNRRRHCQTWRGTARGIFAATRHSARPSTLLVALVAAAACRSTPVEKDYARPLPDGVSALRRVEASRLPDLAHVFDDRARTLGALDESLAYFDRPSSSRHFPFEVDGRLVSHTDQVAALGRLRAILQSARSGAELDARIRREFAVYQSVGWDGVSGEVLFTGYYTPIFRGSRSRHGPYRYPLYRRPADLAATAEGVPLGRRLADGSLAPYPTRREIERGDLLAGLELVYLTDPFDAFIAQVQGSARIELENGATIDIGYAGKTDRPYRSIGAELVARGALRRDEVSLQTLRSYFAAHPEDLSILDVNESYVFFTRVDEPGPFGSLNVAVTPYHSVATDKSVFPRGGPVVVATRLPTVGRDGHRADRPHVGLYFDQDTGGAIRSAGRADLYLGRGREPERIAGFTRSEGRLFYLLLPRSVAPSGAAGTAGP